MSWTSQRKRKKERGCWLKILAEFYSMLIFIHIIFSFHNHVVLYNNSSWLVIVVMNKLQWNLLLYFSMSSSLEVMQSESVLYQLTWRDRCLIHSLWLIHGLIHSCGLCSYIPSVTHHISVSLMKHTWGEGWMLTYC